jgi:hypothetical protein
MDGALHKVPAQYILGMTDSKKTKLSRRLGDESMLSSSMTRDWKGVWRAGREDSICGTTSGWTMIDCKAYRSRFSSSLQSTSCIYGARDGVWTASQALRTLLQIRCTTLAHEGQFNHCHCRDTNEWNGASVSAKTNTVNINKLSSQVHCKNCRNGCILILSNSR